VPLRKIGGREGRKETEGAGKTSPPRNKFIQPLYSYEPQREKHGRLQATVRGALAPPLKICKVFCCISNDSKMLSRRNIYALFSKHSPTSGRFVHPRPASGLRLWTTPEDGSPVPLICSPLETTPGKNPVDAHGEKTFLNTHS